MPKLIAPLSRRAIMTIKDEGFTAIGGAVGLYVLVRPSKRKYYVYRYKDHQGKRSMISLGPVDLIDLEDARAEAIAWRMRIRQGECPSKIRNAERQVRRKAEIKTKIEREKRSRLFKKVGQMWLDERSKAGFWANNVKGEAHHQHWLDKYINPAIGKLRVNKLTPKDVFELIKPIYQTMPTTADKVLNTISSIWRWAQAQGWADGDNPTDRRGPLGVLLEPYKNRAKQQNYPALAFTDVPAFMKVLRDFDHISARLTEFAILTALRSKMVRYLKWDDVNWDNKLITVNESLIKTKRRGNHTLFLSKEAIALLKSLPRINEWIFPSPSKLQPLSDAAMGKVFDILHNENIQNGGQGWLDIEQTKENGNPVRATAHGTCRASFKTWACSGENRKKLDDEAVELCLAHKLKDDYAGAYNRTKLEDERREVMQAWGEFCFSKLTDVQKQRLGL